VTTPRAFVRVLAAVLFTIPVIASRGSEDPRLRLQTQQAAAVPSPESVLGFQPGADYKLANYEQVVAYFQRVAEATDRVRLVQAGRSAQGRPYYFALVSSAENLKKIDRYREIAQRLAHPADLSPEDARALVREGKAFVHIDGGLHSTEVAGPQHTPELLYGLVGRANSAEVAAYLENVIVMIWPTLNPDGQSMVANHYMARVGTPEEAQAMSLPGLYQEYVGHDNNRDAYMLNTVESRVVEHTWRQWEPNIIYVQHQSSPFPTRIWLPPFAEPIATHAPGIVSSQLNMIGMAIAQRLNLEGKVGATHMGDGFDAWYPGYIDYNPVFKNIPAFWTETQGTGPSPRTSQPDQIPAPMRRGAGAVRESVARRHVAHARRGGVHDDRRDGDDRVRLQVQGSAPARALRIRACTDCARTLRGAVRVLGAQSAAGSGGRGGDVAAARIQRRANRRADGSGGLRRRIIPGGYLGGHDRSGVRGARA
jgi:hypothetical protein